MIDEIPLLGDHVKTLRREPRGWAIYYGDNFLRYLTEFEDNFVESALAAKHNPKPTVVYNCCSKHMGQSFSFTMTAGDAFGRPYVTVCPGCEKDDELAR